MLHRGLMLIAYNCIVMEYIDKLIKGFERWIKTVYGSYETRTRNTPSEETGARCDEDEENISRADVSTQNSDGYDHEIIVNQFQQVQSKVLYGTYGSLYRASELMKRSESLLTDMYERISYIDGNEELKGFWNKHRNNPAALLYLIESAGVVRDNREYIIADKDTKKYYSVVGNEKIVPGEKYSVVDPCWTNGDVVLEKGLIELIDKHE